MRLENIPLPPWAAELPPVSFALAALWLAVALVVGVGFAGELSRADGELRSAARQVIHHPELEIPDRLLPVARDLMPGFDSNEMFDFLRRGTGHDEAAQARFDARAAAALARFDRHPARRLGLVPAAPTPHGFLTYPLVHAGVLHAVLTVAIVLLAGPVLERLWGWRLTLLGLTLITLGGAGTTLLTHFGSDRALLGGGAIASGWVAAVIARFRTEPIDFLGWLPASASARLVAPAWALAPAWVVYELAAWMSLPIGVPGLSHSAGVAAHAGGALLGAGLALGVQHLGWEKERPVVATAPAPAPRLDLDRVRKLLDAGQGDTALELLEAGVRRSARNRDAVTLYFRLCCEREEPERAAPALAELVREELRRGAEEVAVARWRDLLSAAPRARVDPATLLRIAGIVRRDGDDELALVALERAAADAGLPSTLAAELARMAVDLSPELAQRAAERALADSGLDEVVRHELRALVKPDAPAAAQDDDTPGRPTGKELPPNVFYEEQDRSAFGEFDDLGAVEDFPAGAVTPALPRSLDPEGLVLEVEGRGEVRIDYARVRAVSVVGVHGLGSKPVLLIDVLVDGAGTERPLAAFRLHSDRFDPRGLAPGSSGGIEALRAVVGQLLAGSEALPLPDAQSAVLRPPRVFATLAAYEQEVLTPIGRQLG